MVSFNHYAAGAVGDWLYRRVAGIEPVEGGCRSFRVAPLMGGGLTFAEGSVLTPYGRASSSWTAEDGRFSWSTR
jgi:alpha-L-rhamnosidase